ncbi:MAG: alkaline phosphatase PhoX [Bacteroidota bacterium]
MSTSRNRREFIRLSTMASLGFLGLSKFACTPSGQTEALRVALSAPGYGPLIKDPKGLFDLPKGFGYQVISRWGDPMDDGLLVPNRGDGMATFTRPDGKMVLIRNHEISPDDFKSGAFGKENERLAKMATHRFYDFGRGQTPGLGGTTSVIFDEDHQQVVSQYMSLAGTIRNCAGGPTPWGSWITCEENTDRADDVLEKDHGFNFEVPATADGLVMPVPLTDMGRFNHEAVCVDPRTGIVYQTEDRGDGLIYRFVPHAPGELQRGGKLQALKIHDAPQKDTRNWTDHTGFPERVAFAVTWIDIENVLSPEDDLRHQGFDKGAAVFARGEGMWFGNNEVYFACTNGGRIQKGQVFRYIPSEFEGTPQEADAPGKLELFAEPNHTDICKHCDNLTVAPWGGLMLCEDADDPNLVGLTPEGKFYIFGKNVGHPDSELTGVCFSPSGRTLFVNIQHAGLTLAIQGPWQKKHTPAA